MDFLPTFSHLESSSLLYGLFFSMKIIEILVQTGLIFLPLIANVVAVVKKSKSNDTSHQLPATLLNYILISATIIIFCFLPLFPVTAKQLEINDGCSNGESRSLYSAEQFDSELRKSDTPKASLWWVIWHKIGGGIVNQLIRNIPCHTDHNLINTLLSTQSITDPQVRKEYTEFNQQCYMRAYNNYLRTSNISIEDEELRYIGNQYFLETPGFYQRCAAPSYNFQSPCYGGSDPGPSNSVSRWRGTDYPTCREWWLGNNQNQGLKDLLYQEAVNDSIFCGLLPQSLVKYLVSTDEDKVIQQMLNNVNENSVLNASGDTETKIAYFFSGISALNNLEKKIDEGSNAVTGAYFTKKFMVLMQPTILMGLMIFFPIFFWLASYRIKALLLYTTIVLAIKSLPAIIVISSYLSNSLGPVTFGDFLSASLIDRTIFMLLGMWLPVIMMITLLIVLGWAGATGGRAIETAIIGQGVASGTLRTTKNISKSSKLG